MKIENEEMTKAINLILSNPTYATKLLIMIKQYLIYDFYKNNLKNYLYIHMFLLANENIKNFHLINLLIEYFRIPYFCLLF